MDIKDKIKIIQVEPAHVSRSPAEASEKEASPLPEGNFDEQSAAWKKLVAGETPSGGTPSELGPMVDADRQARQRQNAVRTRDDAIQELLGGMLFGDDGKPAPEAALAEDLPAIPDVMSILRAQPTSPVGPIVENYVALEKTYTLLEEEKTKTLQKNGILPEEAEQLQAEIGMLRRGLSIIRTQLQHARYFKGIQENQAEEKRQRLKELWGL